VILAWGESLSFSHLQFSSSTGQSRFPYLLLFLLEQQSNKTSGSGEKLEEIRVRIWHSNIRTFECFAEENDDHHHQRIEIVGDN